MRWRALLLLLSLAGAAAAAAPSPGEDGIEFSTIAYVATGVAAAQQSLAQPGPGAGVKLAIMDSGVNWRHPVFGNSRGLACSAIGAAGCRVAAGARAEMSSCGAGGGRPMHTSARTPQTLTATPRPAYCRPRLCGRPCRRRLRARR